jgi:hypothetical protein
MTILTREALYDMGPRLLREVWALTGVAISIIALRVVAKIRIRKFGLDDVLMVFALVSTSLSCFSYSNKMVFDIFQNERSN